MPTQTPIADGFVGCEAVRIAYSPVATPTNVTPLDDDEGRYLLIERTDPAQALRVVMSYTAPNEPYSAHWITWDYFGVNESFDPPTGPIPYSGSSSLYANGTYTRFQDFPYTTPNGAGVTRVYYHERRYWTFDEETGEEYEAVIEVGSWGFPESYQFADDYSASSYSTSNYALKTTDGRAIDPDTGAVSASWSIVVYEVYEWGDSEISRLNFDANPSPVTAVCLGAEDCEPRCVKLYRESDGAYICICKESDEPTLAPTQNRIAPKRQKPPYRPPLDPPVKVAVAANRRRIRKLAPELKRAENAWDNASQQVDANPSEENLQAANLALNRLQTAQREQADLEAAIADRTTESERASGITVLPSRTSTQQWRTPNVTPNNVQQGACQFGDE